MQLTTEKEPLTHNVHAAKIKYIWLYPNSQYSIHKIIKTASSFNNAKSITGTEKKADANSQCLLG